MNEQKDFFSKNHARLLNFALWAKNFAWLVLIVYLFDAVGVFFQEQYQQMRSGAISSHFADFAKMLTHNPVYTFSLFFEITSVLFKGVVYFLVLKGISLGLNMIIETDLNSWRQEKQEGILQK